MCLRKTIAMGTSLCPGLELLLCAAKLCNPCASAHLLSLCLSLMENREWDNTKQTRRGNKRIRKASNQTELDAQPTPCEAIGANKHGRSD